VAPPPAPTAPEQPACRSLECSSCAAEPSACIVAGTPWLCHPWTGSCSLPCAPESASSQCPREQRCHPDYGLCVECVGVADCAGATPACDPQRNVCVECTGDANCSAPTPACDTSAQRCVPCTRREHCAAGQVCDPAQHTCVQCVSSADCANLGGDNDRNVCDPANHVCVECLTNADCKEPDKPFCKASELECDDDSD
jgi:Cys-rich repeat protein